MSILDAISSAIKTGIEWKRYNKEYSPPLKFEYTYEYPYMCLSIVNMGRVPVTNLVIWRVEGPNDSTDLKDSDDEISGISFDIYPGEDVRRHIGYFEPGHECEDPDTIIRLKVSFEADGKTEQYTRNILLKRRSEIFYPVH